MKKGTAIFPGWLFPFVYCVAGVDAYVIPFICIWFAVRDVFSNLSDLSKIEVGKWGWMAVAFAVGSMAVYKTYKVSVNSSNAVDKREQPPRKDGCSLFHVNARLRRKKMERRLQEK